MAIKFSDKIAITIAGRLDKFVVFDVGNAIYTSGLSSNIRYFGKRFDAFNETDIDNFQKIPVEGIGGTTWGFSYDDGESLKTWSILFGQIQNLGNYWNVGVTVTYYDYNLGRNNAFGSFVRIPINSQYIYISPVRIRKSLSTGQFPEGFIWDRIFLGIVDEWNAGDLTSRYLIPICELGYNQIGDTTLTASFPSNVVIQGRIPIDDNTDQPPGAQGPGDFPDEPIDDDGEPDEIITYCKLFSMYNPSKVTLSLISDWLNSGTFLDAWTHKSDAINSVVSLHSVPIRNLNIEVNSFKIGGHTPDSPISCPTITKQFYDIDLGTINVPPVVQGFMDYAPAFKMALYLPFHGTIQLNTDDFMQNSINVKYKIDIVTGDFVAFVSNSTKILHQIKGNCATKYPLTSTDYSQIYSTGLSIAGELLRNPTPLNVGAQIPNLLQLSAMKPAYSYSGGLGGSSGLMALLYPYLIVHRPTISLPKDFDKYYGFASNINARLGNVKGYTRVKEIHLNIPEAFPEEIAELEQILKTGVVL